MNLVSGRPFWPAHNRPMPRYLPLREHLSCDVAVIGAGYTGSLISHQLNHLGLEVVTVDRRDIGAGSTSASTALIEYQLDADLNEFIELAGARHAVRAYRVARDAVGRLENIVRGLDDRCEWQRRCGLHLASSPSAIDVIRGEITTRRRYGFRAEWLPAKDLADEYGIRAPGALLYQEAAQVDPYRLAHTLLRDARSGGARAYARSEVRRFECQQGRVRLETTGGFRITARFAVFATGYESLGYIGRRLAQLVSTYALVSRPRKHWPAGLQTCVLTETRDPYLYVRSTADGRIMMGGEDEPFSNPSTRARHLRTKTRALLRRFDRWFPNLRPAVSRAWAGAFAATRDGLGYVDQAREYPNVYFVIGAGGNGMLFSMIAADILRDLIRGRTNRDAHLFRFDRPWNRTRQPRR